ncbi:MAG: hypothetical protein ACE5GM_10680, partial [bacterium]
APVSRTSLYNKYHDKIYMPEGIRPFFTGAAYAGYAQADPGTFRLIASYPDIFCSFYCYQTPDMDKKARAVNKLFPGEEIR